MAPAIAIKGLTKNFGAVRAVSNLDLEVKQGEAFCLLGPNGAGKSTTINLMLGLTKPDNGSVHVFGHEPHSSAAQQMTGYVAQDSDFPPLLTVREIIKLVRCHYQNPHPADELIEKFGLEDIADRLTGGFSGGQRRRLALALAFAGNGKLVFLDEPTTGLDSKARKNFWAYSKEYVKQGGTLVLTTHHLEEIEGVADRICLINQGEIQLEGSVKEIQKRLGQKHIHFACDNLPSLSPISQLVHENGHAQIISPDADEIVRQLVASGVAFNDLEIRNASLEEAIEKLTVGGDAQ
ncbi:MAG: ABC transporter ATP-binding protein [Rhizobiaceae bacterium]|nr:ABC transporter ATP-binding protein [Rhizobiaceae bacterium]